MNFSLSKYLSLFPNKRLCWSFCLFVSFLLLAAIFNYAYFNCKSHLVDVETLSSQIHKKETVAEKLLNKVVQQVQEKGVNTVARNVSFYEESEKNNIAIYIIKSDSICWWSSKVADVRSAGEIPYAVQFFLPTQSCHCIGLQRADAQYRYVALAKVRQRTFKSGSNGISDTDLGITLPQEIPFVDRSAPGASHIFARNGTYLFSLKIGDKVQFNSLFLNVTGLFLFFSVVALFVFCLSLCALSRAGLLSRRKVTLVCLGCGLLVVCLAFADWPGSVFSTEMFSKVYYSSALVPSLGHLVVYNIAFFLLFCLFRALYSPLSLQRLLNANKPFVFVLFVQLFSAVLFLLAYCLTVHLVHNSAMDVATTLAQDISLVTIVSLFMVIPWFFFAFYLANILARTYSEAISLKLLLVCRFSVVLFGCIGAWLAGGGLAHFVAWGIFSFATICAELYCHFQVKRTLLYIAFVDFLLINLTVAVCYLHCAERNNLRYDRLAELLTNNVELVYNKADEAALLDNAKFLEKDAHFHRLMADTSALSFENLEHYLLETYFDGFGNKYEFDVQLRSSSAPFMIRQNYYDKTTACSPGLIANYCVPVVGSQNIFICKRPDVPLAYLCVFPYKDKVAYVLLYPCLSVYRQEQDAQLFSPANSVFTSEKFSVAKYYKNELLYASGDYHFPNTATWIPNVNRRKFHIYKSESTHFVSRFYDDGFLVVTKSERASYTYFIFISYLCGFFALGILFYSLFIWASMQRRHAQYSFLTRMQIWLLVPLLFAFIVLAVCSMYFFRGQYQEKAISNMSEQAGSIQHNLQHKLGFVTSLENVDQRRFTQDVKDLSNLFRADIIIYDAAGCQVTSSRTPFLYKRRSKNSLIYPQAFFLRQPEFFRSVRIGDYVFFTYYTNLYNQRNELIGYVNVRSSAGAEQMRNELFNLMVILIDVYLVIVLLTIIISWLISRRFTKPVTMLADQFKEIKLTGSNQKVEYTDNDEFGSLVQQYNIMVDKLHSSAEQLAQSQRELAWRDMARRIAHEIKNPLTPMKLSVQMAQMKMQRDPENFPEYFGKTSSLLIEQIDNLSRIASEFSTFAKTTVTVREEVELASKVKSVVSLFENNAEGVRFVLDMHGVDKAMVWSDNNQILQVFNNLFRNAIQAIPESVEGLVRVDFSIKGDAAFVSIADNGCGIPEENLQTIFEPNFTTKTSGMGLGLSIVKTIVNMASGDIWVESTVGVGTTFFVSIPLIKPGEQAGAFSLPISQE